MAKLERFIAPPSAPLSAMHVSGFTITCDLRDAVGRSLFYKGTMEERATEALTAVLLPGDTFIDIGANAGHFSFLAASIVGPSGSVHAVEASPPTAHRLKEDVARNKLSKRIVVHSMAVSDQPGQLRLQDVDDSLSPLGMRYLDPRETTRGTLVEVTTGDVLFDEISPRAIKIDVEGADLRVLHGLSRLLRSRPPALVLCEAVDDQLSRFGDSEDSMIAYMAEVGFEARDVTDDVGARAWAFTPTSDAPDSQA